MDTCPERMDAADVEAPRPPRIETAVEFWTGVEFRTGVETAARVQVAVDNCTEMVHLSVLYRF